MNLWYDAHVTVIQQSFIFMLLALSIQVVLRAGVSSFASVAFYGIGGYVAANLANGGLPFAATLAVATVGSGVLGYLLFRPLNRLRGLYLGMVTFAIIQIVVVLATNGGDFTGGAIGLYGVPLQTTTGGLALIALVAILAMSQLERSSLGRAFAAMRVDDNLAQAMGLEVRRLRTFVFALSAALGAASGALNVLTFTVLAPGSFGFDLLVTALTMAVVGGVTSWRGAVIGAIVVTWFPTIFTFLDGTAREIIYGLVVVLIMTYQPDGILGLLRSARRRLQERHAHRNAKLGAESDLAHDAALLSETEKEPT